MITPDRLKELLEYDPDTGLFIWKVRPLGPKEWNTRFAGKSAFAFVGKRGYCVSTIDNNPALTAHRVAWAIFYGEWPSGEIDHINGVTTDNRIENLRLATSAQNSHNTRSHKDSVSRFKGVSFDSARGKWCAEIMKNGRRWRLGRFSTEEDAAKAYAEKALELHGEYARLS